MSDMDGGRADDRELQAVRDRLAEAGVRPTDEDLRDIAAGWSILVRWHRVLQEMVTPTAEPATTFTADAVTIDE
jgi:hypothetical protein